MKNIFNAVQFKKPKQNKFDMSHEKKISFKPGYMIPSYVQEVIPGDKFRVNQEMLLRMQPLLAPIFHRVRIQTDFFYVPYRLIWDEFDDFITGGEDGLQAPVAPFLNINTANLSWFAKGGLGDYLGIPTTEGLASIAQVAKISALPFRAYQLIWDEYYRDQNLQTKMDCPKTSGDQNANIDKHLPMHKRAWEKDYFTSALPFAQKGPPVNIPTVANYKDQATVTQAGAPTAIGAHLETQGALGNLGLVGSAIATGIENLESIGITINDLRTSARLQEWLEKNARAGSRLAEFILAHFGTATDDLRIGRPQYLGGHNSPIVISEVLSSFQQADDAGYPQGNMTGHGIGAASGAGFNARFKEHGFVMGICSVLPRTTYQQGIPKMFQRFDKFDYPFPSFAHLGEQEIKLGELYHDYASAVTGEANTTFGYQSRYADWKYIPSTVHGDFRDTLAFWQWGRIFNAKPQLNASFVQSDPDARIFAVTDQEEDQLLAQIYNRVDVIRSLPYFSNPKL